MAGSVPKPDGTALPAYSPRTQTSDQEPTSTAQQSEHVTSLEDEKGRTWLRILLKSRQSNKGSPAMYFEGDTVVGRVELDLKAAESFKKISLTVQGAVTTVGQEENAFLKVDRELWAPPMGIPKESSSSSKFQGKFSWPFSVDLPKTVSPPVKKGETKAYPLPPTFSERASPSYIDYKVVVTIKRGMLKGDKTLASSFIYVPIIQAGTPSESRCQAYTEGTSLVGPEGDPDGWTVLPTVNVKGKLFEKREVEVACQLAIAAPLSYSRGTPIPLYMTLSGDSEAVSLLAQGPAIRVHLVRSLTIGGDAAAAATPAPARSNHIFAESSARAAFWPADESKPEEGKKVLLGEIDIAKALKPSFVFPEMSVRYAIELLPFEATGFTSANNRMDKLSSTNVDIVTVRPPGPASRSYAPPGYKQEEKGDYSNVMGLLENGNQRFLSHDHALG